MKYIILAILATACFNEDDIIYRNDQVSDLNYERAVRVCKPKGGLASLMSCNETGHGLNTRHCEALCLKGRIHFKDRTNND